MYEQAASSDYRLNHRLRVTCKQDIDSLCKAACNMKNADQVSRGQVGGVWGLGWGGVGVGVGLSRGGG